MLLLFILPSVALCGWVFIVMIRHENFLKRKNITEYKRRF